ncbi:MAG: hypothetical protein J3K34DRAFT_423538 [Monoraphidium minutum]|nr:MAG: hypothetical protein J3K34DRAFT_423538 [Monoraphidium minutum]
MNTRAPARRPAVRAPAAGRGRAARPPQTARLGAMRHARRPTTPSPARRRALCAAAARAPPPHGRIAGRPRAAGGGHPFACCELDFSVRRPRPCRDWPRPVLPFGPSGRPPPRPNPRGTRPCAQRPQMASGRRLHIPSAAERAALLYPGRPLC